MNRKYSKPSITLREQVELLKSRGLVIEDHELAINYLRRISYYRLRAYWLYYEIDPQNQNHRIKTSTSFEMVLALYNFDRELRLLLLDAIERIEVAVRAAWSHNLAQRYGPHGYLNSNLYPDKIKFNNNIEQLKKEFSRSHDVFVKHYKQTYSFPSLPPIWMSAEFISFGLLSKFYSSLGAKADRKIISQKLGLSETILDPFLHHLATIRNICAHHSRLWNRGLTVTAKIPQSPASLSQSVNPESRRKIYNTLTLVAHIMEIISPDSCWKNRAVKVINSNPCKDLISMGFIENWQETPTWRL